MSIAVGLTRFVVVLAFLVTVGAGGTRAVPAPDRGEPYLRIETGEHEAIINHMGIAPDGSAVFTVSDDKTARAWSADDLQPLGVMRPPIGPADDGALYAIAVSSRLIAMGGRVRDANNEFAVHLFARPDLHPVGNIAQFPEPIRALRFSADGNQLAVGMQDRGGIRVLDLAAHTEVLRDSAYDGAVMWLDFDPHGALAVVADDAKLHLYSADHKQSTSYGLPGGARAWSVAFSPDGARIAVGDRQRPLVHIFDVAKARFGHDFEGTPQRQGALGVVAFSRDGQTLFAGGTYKDATVKIGPAARLIRRWAADGRALGESAVAGDTITDLAATDGGVAFVTAEPAIGRLDNLGRVVAARRSRHIDFRDTGPTTFRISDDGALIELSVSAPTFGQTAVEKRAPSAFFDVISRRFVPRDEVTVPVANPFASVAGTGITEWLNSHTPRVNGQLVALEPAETVHAVAVLPGGGGVAMGTDFYVRLVALGKEKWRAITTAPVFAVNISGDGRIVVAGLGDGTVHWYRATDGRELLALFADPATGRWVLSTPEGYFDHDHRLDGSADGRTMIGFQIATPGSGANPFIEIGQLYPRFFRPDLVGLSFRDDDASRQAVRDQHERLGSVPTILARGLPPRFRLLDLCPRAVDDAAAEACPPRDTGAPLKAVDTTLSTTADSVRIRFGLDMPAGEVGGVIIRRDHAVISPPTAVETTDPHHRTEVAEIALGLGVNDITFTPVSPGGGVEANEPQSTHVTVTRTLAVRGLPGAGAQETIATAEPTTPRPVTLHVLSIGVSHYKSPLLLLANAAHDAEAFVSLMRQPTPPVDTDVDVLPLLLDGQATRTNILAALKELAARAKPDDLVLIFFAGHGSAVDGQYYFAPFDLGSADHALFHRANYDPDPAVQATAYDEVFRTEGLSQQDVLPLIQSIKAARVAIVLDTCYSATLANVDTVIRRDRNDTVTNALGHAGGRFILSGATTEALDASTSETAAPTAVGGADAAPGADSQGHGLLSSFLLRALAGEADSDHTGRIDIYKLSKYVSANVEKASIAMHKPQKPAIYFAGAEFFDLRAISSAQAQAAVPSPP